MFTQLSAVWGGLFGEFKFIVLFFVYRYYSFYFSFENFHVNCIAPSRSQLELARKWSDFWLFFSLLALFPLARMSLCGALFHALKSFLYILFSTVELVELSVSTIATGRAKSPNQFSLSLSFLREWCHIFNEKQCWCWTARAAPLTHRKKATTYRQHPNKHRNYHISNLLSTFCSTVLTACPDG